MSNAVTEKTPTLYGLLAEFDSPERMLKAAEKVRAIAKSVEEILRFHQSQTPDFQKGYEQDYRFALSAGQTLLAIADYIKDEGLKKELEAKLNPYMPVAPPMPGLPQ